MTFSYPRLALADRPVLLVLLASALWACSNIILKLTVSDVGPLMITALRCLLAAAVLTPFLRAEATSIRDARWWGSAIPVAIVFATGMTLQSVGYLAATASDAAFLMNALVVFTPLLAWAALGQTPTPALGLAVILVLVGAWALMGMPSTFARMQMGEGIILISALCYAVWHILLGRHLTLRGGPWATTWAGMALAGVVLLPASLALEPQSGAVLWAALPLILILGILGTALPYVLCAQAQIRISAPVAVLLIASESVFTAVFAAVILSERMTAMDAVGALLILIATALAAFYGTARPRAAAEAPQDASIQG